MPPSVIKQSGRIAEYFRCGPPALGVIAASLWALVAQAHA
jgi:hypothetical protein